MEVEVINDECADEYNIWNTVFHRGLILTVELASSA
jgi:hypothetical protein